jgi:hypothetical protein
MRCRSCPSDRIDGNMITPTSCVPLIVVLTSGRAQLAAFLSASETTGSSVVTSSIGSRKVHVSSFKAASSSSRKRSISSSIVPRWCLLRNKLPVAALTLANRMPPQTQRRKYRLYLSHATTVAVHHGLVYRRVAVQCLGGDCGYKAPRYCSNRVYTLLHPIPSVRTLQHRACFWPRAGGRRSVTRLARRRWSGCGTCQAGGRATRAARYFVAVVRCWAIQCRSRPLYFKRAALLSAVRATGESCTAPSKCCIEGA